MDHNNYLTNIPQDIEKYGLCKTLLVRHEIIHIKHILTEIFVRKNIDIQKYLDKINWTLFNYMEYMTNRIRKVHHFSRDFIGDINNIVKSSRDNFFPTIDLYKGLDVLIVLDFDGVVTENSFSKLYELCLERNRTVICSANPTIDNTWFEKRNYILPNKIYSCKGKIKKIIQLIELNQRNDYVFYVDNEEEYLEFAWIFGLQTYHYKNKKIQYFTLKTK
jgi:hypothetical protein